MTVYSLRKNNNNCYQLNYSLWGIKNRTFLIKLSFHVDVINPWSNHVKTRFGVMFSLCNFLNDWNWSEHYFFNQFMKFDGVWVVLNVLFTWFNIKSLIKIFEKIWEIKKSCFCKCVHHTWFVMNTHIKL